MHIDLDAFFVSVEQVDNPSLRGKPVVVGGRPEQRGVIAAASYEARAYGLRSGMPLSTASRRCPQCIFIVGDFTKYRRASRHFMEILADSAPQLEPLGLDEAYLDVTGFESLYGSLEAMGRHIKQRVRDEIGICASIGLTGSKVAAKIASDLSKPDGLLIVPPGGDREFLAPLAIDRLPGVGPKTEKALRGIGIRTIGDLARFPAAAIKGRFGIWGERLQKHAAGEDERPVTPPAEAKSISRETTFASDVSDPGYLRASLHYLAEDVGRRLRRREREAHCVVIKVRFADFTTITRRQTLLQGTRTDQTIYETGLKLLDKVLGREKPPLRLIGIGVAGLSEPASQLSLLDNSDLRLEKLNSAVDAIRRKYGFGSIQTGETFRLQDIFGHDRHHQPDSPLSRE
jgi:DNA polymerase-4